MHDPDAPGATETPVTTPPSVQAPRPLVSDWLVQSASLGWRVLAVVALGVVALGAAAVLGSVVAAVVLAAVVTAAFDPLTERLKARGRSPNVAAAIVTLTVGAGGLVVIAVLAIVFIPALLDIVRSIEAGLASIQDTLEAAGVPPPASTVVSEFVSSAADWLSSAVGALVVTVANTVTVLLLAFFLLFFMVTDLDRSIDWMLQAALPSQRAAVTDATDTARHRLGRTLRETAVRAAVLGAVALAVGLLFGVPAPLALALLVLLGAFIPLIGPIATTAFFALAVLAAAGGLAAILSVVALVIVTLALPRVLGPDAMRGYGVHPMVVLVALSIGAIVGGVLGMVLGVPVVLVLSIVGPAVISALDASPDDEETEGIVPRWLDRLAQWSVRLLVLFGVVAVLVIALGQVPLLLIPLILAGVAAATLAPGVSALLGRGLTPTAASLAMTIGGFGVILVVVLGALAALGGPMQEIVATASMGAGRIDALAGSTSLVTIVAAAGPELIRFTLAILGAVAGFGIVVVVGSILTFYLLRDGAAGFELVTSRFTRWRHDEMEEVARRASNVLGGYMIGTGVVSVVGAGAQFILMTLLGLPLAWPLAVLSFLGGYIPYIGPFLTTSLAFLVTVAVGTPTEVAIMFVFTLVINIVQGNIVAPLVYGKTVNIHPAVVLLAIPAGSAIAGIAGMFLAVPVVGILATTWRIVLHVFARRPLTTADQA